MVGNSDALALWEAMVNGGLVFVDRMFTPIINPWVEKSFYNCMTDTLFFDDHSIINHEGVSWQWEITPDPEYIE